ncbi:MAG: hypothetical protein WBA98_13845 [Gordonia sp. (in: high G+C Gram-positive bacteria)]|uniref:hypothetical protein n=1 Tax=Gordonia sp. (in: high G+C Gram-positive bacteria) TaxID=84139 RepID=UPI003C72B962
MRKKIMGLLNRFYSNYIDGNRLMQAVLAIGTCAIVFLTLWLTGGLALFGGWFGLDWAWLRSPLAG